MRLQLDASGRNAVMQPAPPLLRPRPQVIAQRLSKLATFKRHGSSLGRQPAEVLIKRRKRGRNGEAGWEVVRARGHMDEVQELRRGGSKLGERRGGSGVGRRCVVGHGRRRWLLGRAGPIGPIEWALVVVVCVVCQPHATKRPKHNGGLANSLSTHNGLRHPLSTPFEAAPTPHPRNQKTHPRTHPPPRTRTRPRARAPARRGGARQRPAGVR